MKFLFTQQTEKEFFKLEKTLQIIIRKKIEKIKKWEWYKIKSLVNMLPATHRLRIQNLRMILRKVDEWYEVLKIGQRSNIYK